jgi:hypothetical protein
MAPRTQLQSLLEEVLGTDDVYFQPPNNVQMTYPCIVYHLDDADTKRAGNILYNHTWRYMVTVIDRDPDSTIREGVLNLPLCEFRRHYTKNNLNHDVFDLYY